MQFHQVLVAATPGDASTNAAFELQRLLQRVGPSEIFARYIDPALAGRVHNLEAYSAMHPTGSASDVLLFHASIGEPNVFSFITERPERLVLVYHNISPSAPFLRYDPAFAGLLDGGRRELSALRDRVTLALADSEFNAVELRGLGYSDVRVSRLIVDTPAMLGASPDPDEADWLAGIPGPVFLFVGQLNPHKRPDLLIKAFHVLVTYLLPEASLFIVGKWRFEAYTRALVTMVRELNLHNVHMRGSVNDSQLNAYYRRADTFVTASEHEGFLVPLLEAMAFDLPIIARSHGAVPETLETAGVLLPSEEDPLLLAEAMAEVATNLALRSELIERGHRRLRDFDPDKARAAVLQHLISVA